MVLNLPRRQVEEVAVENRDLVQKLSVQEEALQYSGQQLEKRSSESLSLNRQLETALNDVTQQVRHLYLTPPPDISHHAAGSSPVPHPAPDISITQKAPNL